MDRIDCSHLLLFQYFELRDQTTFILMLKFGTVSASPWDYASPSPVPIRASGASVKSSSSRYGRTSHQVSLSRESSQSFEVA